MTCDFCEKAKVKQCHDTAPGCKGCRLREVARGSHFDRVRRTGCLDTRYIRFLEGFDLKHEDVKAAAAADYMQRDKQ